jgi:hypothetical protein
METRGKGGQLYSPVRGVRKEGESEGRCKRRKEEGK